MSKFPRQLFIIPPETWFGVDREECNATASAMQELGIFKLPYPEVDIWLPANESFGWTIPRLLAESGMSIKTLMEDVERGLYVVRQDENYTPAIGSGFVFELRGISLEREWFDIAVHVAPGSPAVRFYRAHCTSAVREVNGKARDALATILIVLLATRNAIKSTKENKCAKLGIGKGEKKYQYVTTISIPHVREEDDASVVPGARKAAHLRRGHIRRQHYGPKNCLLKQVWIEPCFVNADPQWVSQRERYNISLGSVNANTIAKEQETCN